MDLALYMAYAVIQALLILRWGYKKMGCTAEDTENGDIMVMFMMLLVAAPFVTAAFPLYAIMRGIVWVVRYRN